MSAARRRFLVRSFLRSFSIQGSWNYRTMIGGGFGHAILPALRWLYRGNSAKLTEATGPVAQKMYAAQAEQGEAAAAGAEAGAQAEGPAGGEDVVDVEFEEVKDDEKK